VSQQTGPWRMTAATWATPSGPRSHSAGGAESPFVGYLDAPFVSRIDRTAIDESVPLNSFLLDQGARLCLHASEALSAKKDEKYGPVVARLLAWSDASRSRLIAAASEGLPFQERELVPVQSEHGGQPRYAMLAKTFAWAPVRATVLLNPRRLSQELSIDFLDNRVEEMVRNRMSSLRHFLLGSDFTPNMQLVAEWAERLAATLLARWPRLRIGTRSILTSRLSSH
jgi:hypothetical protein